MLLLSVFTKYTLTIPIQKVKKKEQLNAIQKMIKAGATKEQIVSFGYTEKELAKAEGKTTACRTSGSIIIFFS